MSLQLPLNSLPGCQRPGYCCLAGGSAVCPSARHGSRPLYDKDPIGGAKEFAQGPGLVLHHQGAAREPPGLQENSPKEPHQGY